MKALSWILGKKGICLVENGNKCLKMRGTRQQRQFCGTEDIGNPHFVFGEQRNKVIYFRGIREQLPPPLGGPHNKTVFKSVYTVINLKKKTCTNCCNYIFIFVMFVSYQTFLPLCSFPFLSIKGYVRILANKLLNASVNQCYMYKCGIAAHKKGIHNPENCFFKWL